MEPEDAVIISRLAAIVEKEEPIERILKIVRKIRKWYQSQKACNDVKQIRIPGKSNAATYLSPINRGRK